MYGAITNKFYIYNYSVINESNKTMCSLLQLWKRNKNMMALGKLGVGKYLFAPIVFIAKTARVGIDG